MSKEKLCITIFRNNLRVSDNMPLKAAFNSCEKMICLYSTKLLEGENLGFKKCGKYRKEFIYESLKELKKALLKKNIWLYVIEDIDKTLEKLNERFYLKLYFEKEVGIEEKEFEKSLEKYECNTFFNQTMIEPFNFDYTKSFSHFRKFAQKLQIKEPIKEIGFKNQLYTIVDIKETPLPLEENINFIKGGEQEAIKRVEFYLENFMHKYLETRNLLEGENISTMFSPYLACGCISARQIYFKLKQYEEKFGNSKSSYWIYFELLWRDFFHLVMLQSNNKLFLKKGIREIDFNFKEDKELLKNFFMGNTGVEIIDTAVLQLKTSGWISNKQRLLTARYFSKNLELDFRFCAAFFEEYLLDYNPASNYGNFAYQAGVGNDKREGILL